MQPEDLHGKRVLISSLNWGMGHVSRSMGLMHQLLKQDNEIVVACDQEQLSFFHYYFPEITFELIDGYPFNFRGKGNFTSDLLKNWSSLKKRVKDEQKEVADLVRLHGINVVVSDHRYGFYSTSVPSIFITHQYHLPVSQWQFLADQWHKKRMDPFQYIWIMDYEGSPLSGKLTQSTNDDRVTFIGPYSRFMMYDNKNEKSENAVVVISGPQIYAQQFADAMQKVHPEATFVCQDSIQLDPSIRKVSGNWLDQDAVILRSKRLISRSGYSTIMDLEFLRISGELYATPSQSEQLYLHKRLTDSSEYIPLALRDHS